MTSTLAAPSFGTREARSLATKLRLTPFEEYMLLDDTDDYPMAFYNRYRLHGPLDREALDAALGDVQLRHPLFCARVERLRGRWHWVPSEQPLATIHWTEPDEEPPPFPRLNLTERAGLYAHGVAQGDFADICLQIHHACCDGLGSVQFLRDWLLAYTARTEGKPPGTYWQPLDAGRLPSRSTPGLPWFRWPKFLWRQSVGLAGVRSFLSRKPVPLAPGSEHAGGPAAPVSVSQSLSSAATAALLQAARSAGVTLNECVLRDFFLVLHAWRRERGFSRPDEWLRISTPMNLRDSHDRLLPAVNVMSTVFLDSQAADHTQPDQLLRNLHDAMECIKRNALGWTFIGSLAVARLFPGVIERGLRKNHCESTAIFSNWGRVLEDWPLGKDEGRISCGNLVLEHFDVASIIRHQTNLCLLGLTYAGRLRLTLAYDPRVITRDDATDILHRLMDRLEEPAGAGG